MTPAAIITFIGIGATPELAIGDAQEEANGWLERHQHRTADGSPAYTMSTYLFKDKNYIHGWRYAIHLPGPIEADGEG